ncbi:hypothetical protein D3C75_632460 [compost metagenome]
MFEEVTDNRGNRLQIILREFGPVIIRFSMSPVRFQPCNNRKTRRTGTGQKNIGWLILLVLFTVIPSPGSPAKPASDSLEEQRLASSRQ